MSSLRLLLSFLFLLLAGRAAVGAGTERIAANPQKGFSWAYFLYTPPSYKSPVTLVVEPNDSPVTTNDQVYHESLANSWAVAASFWAAEIGSPLLVPAIPRTTFGVDLGWDVNPQMLPRELFLNKVSGLERLDLQLMAMIDDAREKLAARGVITDRKVFMWGASSQATFINRFTLLHPDRVKAASMGSTEFQTLPVAVWKGSTLNYPLGIADLQSLVGQPFDLAAFQKVPLQIYQGDADRNWTQIRSVSYTPPNDALFNTLFGGPETFRRMPGFEEVFKSVQCSCQFLVFPGMGHDFADWSYVKEFFEHNRTEPVPASLAKPLLYRLYFPHVASSGQWSTEVALTNATPVSIQGQLQAFKADGAGPTETIAVSLAPSARKEITVGNAFQKPQDIAYLVFLSDSGFVGGYTRFNQPGNRVSLPISGATKQGMFPKIERNGGWTGMAFVNTESALAVVTLTAFDDSGVQIGAGQITVGPGAKIVGMADQVFPFDLSKARYASFSSDRFVVAFSVSGSADGLALDGISALREYAIK